MNFINNGKYHFSVYSLTSFRGRKAGIVDGILVVFIFSVGWCLHFLLGFSVRLSTKLFVTCLTLSMQDVCVSSTVLLSLFSTNLCIRLS